MSNIKEIKNCYGCESCRQKCPKSAIRVEKDKDGFMRAHVIEDMCVNCGLCLEACPVKVNSFNNNPKPTCYAGWADDSIRLKSSSGGLSTAIGKLIIKQGGYVAGVAWDSLYSARYILTNNEEDLEKIRSSKYVQAETGDIYQNIKELLENNKLVYFCGTPCHVAGLKAFLGKEYDNLYVADIACHGTPSSKVLRKYLNDNGYLNPEAGIERVDFRDKSYYGWNSAMNIYFKSCDPVRIPANDDYFYKAFLNQLSLNSTCETCQFSRMPRQGDLTLADFWNIEKYDPTLNDNKGTSVILVNNEKGKKLLEQLDVLSMLREVPFEFLYETVNSIFFRPFKRHQRRSTFFRQLDSMPFNDLVDRCLKNKYDVGLVTTFFAKNYGAMMTAYALYRALEKNGYEVLMLRKPKDLWSNTYLSDDASSKHVLEFAEKHYNLSYEFNTSFDSMTINDLCDAFIVGSDQLWNPHVYAKRHYFFLDFVFGKKKISYATSIGTDVMKSDENEQILISSYLKDFDNLSVREKLAADMCKKYFKVRPKVVCDPVFLLDKQDYLELCEEKQQGYDYKYIFVYLLNGNKEKIEFISRLAEKTGLKVVYVDMLETNELYKYDHRDFILEPDNSVENWLNRMNHAEMIVSDSFHSMCLSLILHKKFINFINKYRGKIRLKELAKTYNVEKNIISEDAILDTNIDDVILNMDSIDFERVDKIKAEKQSYGMKYLLGSLKSKSKKKRSAEHFREEKLRNELYRLQRDITSKQRLETYSNIGQLGIAAPCTVNAIIDKLPMNSYFQQVQGNYNEPVVGLPSRYGVLTIRKTTNYFIEVTFTETVVSKPTIYIGKVVNQKVVEWTKLVAE